MSWEDQGRQEHGRFGTGTSDQTTVQTARPPTVAALVSAVVDEAGQALPMRLRSSFDQYLGAGGEARLARAIPVWIAAAHADPSNFRSRFVGPTLSREGGAALQAMGAALSDAVREDTIRAAGQRLAEAIGSRGDGDWRYGMTYAAMQATYADRNGLVPDPAKLQGIGPDHKSFQVAARGDMRCEGGPGGCAEGGSYGTTGSYSVRGSILCRDCAVKKTGADGLPGAEQIEILKPHLLD